MLRKGTFILLLVLSIALLAQTKKSAPHAEEVTHAVTGH